MRSIDELRNEIRILKDDNIDTDELVRIADAIEREVEERYIEGPTDKYGEPVRVGDVLQGERLYDGWCEPFEVHRLRIESDGWHACEKCGKGHIVKRCRHKPPTVEDVLRDFAYCCEDGATDKNLDEIVAEYALKLQLREED